MNRFAGKMVFLFFLWFPGSFSVAGDASLLTNERIFVANEFQAKDPAVRWADDEAKLLWVDNGALVLENPSSGKRQILVQRDLLIPSGQISSGQTTPLLSESWAFSGDKTKLLIFTNSKRAWRHNTLGDYWLLNLQTNELFKLGGDAPSQSLMFAKLSPDGKHVAYVRENNIFCENLETREIRPLTTNGGDRFINGTFDWVYEEEFMLTDGFCWSPDSRSVAFWELDTENVPVFKMIDNTSSFYPVVKEFKYPRAGEMNAAARIGVVSIDNSKVASIDNSKTYNGETVWMNLPGDPRENYITMLRWPEMLVIQQFNRAQNLMTLFQGNPETGETTTILTDSDDAWIDLRPIRFFCDNREFLFESERNGNRQIFRKTMEKNSEPEPVTPPVFDVIGFVAFNAEEDGIYFYASPGDATRQYLFHVGLGGRNCRQITPEGTPGVHRYDVSPDGTLAIHRYSSFGVPPVCEIVELPSHRPVRLLENHAKLKEKFENLLPCTSEFFQTETEPGIVIDGWCMFPSDFDPSQKYPVLVYVYGEPAGQTVLDQWGGNNYLWHWMLTQQGYVVMSFDNRGTPAPKGRDWRKAVYRNIGTFGVRDQALAIQKTLCQRPYLDPKRVGIWGWSGGGSMTLHALFQYPELYTMGIAIAPVADERYYDTIYQERYMGNPKQGAEEDYRRNSPVTYAKNLAAELLLVHGTGDDNCHYQTTELLVNELIRHDKSFTMMAYPSRSHGIFEGDGTTLHLRNLMARFIKEKLPVPISP